MEMPNIFHIVYVPIIAILIIGLYFLVPFLFSSLSNISLSGKASCATADCFIEAANECRGAVFKQAEEGAVFMYDTENCTLTKKLAKIDETEPEEMKDLLEGKSMKCEYEKGDFNPDLITTLSIGIDSCSGELKDAITEIVYSI